MLRSIISGAVVSLLLWTHPAAAESTSELIGAAQVGDRARVADLLSRAADPNLADADGTTALHWSVRLGDLETKLLIKGGARVGAANRQG
jgi:ankyrin repeat protein